MYVKRRVQRLTLCVNAQEFAIHRYNQSSKMKLNKEYYDDAVFPWSTIVQMQHSHFHVIIGGHVLVKCDNSLVYEE